MKIYLSVLFSLILLSTALVSRATEIVFNEIYYNDLDQNQWVELYNAGGVEVDIGGWIFSRHSTAVEGEYLMIPQNTVIPPGKFMLLCADAEALGANFDPPQEVGILEWGSSPNGQNLSLEEDGDDIYLLNVGRMVVDVVWYGDGGDRGSFQAAPSVGQGHSLGRFPDGAGGGVPSVDFHDYREPTPGVANPPFSGLNKSTWGKIKAMYSVRRS